MILTYLLNLDFILIYIFIGTLAWHFMYIWDWSFDIHHTFREKQFLCQPISKERNTIYLDISKIICILNNASPNIGVLFAVVCYKKKIMDVTQLVVQAELMK